MFTFLLNLGVCKLEEGRLRGLEVTHCWLQVCLNFSSLEIEFQMMSAEKQPHLPGFVDLLTAPGVHVDEHVQYAHPIA